MTFLYLFSYLILFFGAVNLIRIFLFLIGSDIYGLVNHLNRKNSNKAPYQPKVSVVIPAYNEQATIIRCLNSVVNNAYPKHLLDILVVDDGSSDATNEVVKAFILKNADSNIKLVTQENSGKAHALNNAIRNHSTGSIIMCLDSDSYIEKDAIRNAAQYFKDESVAALSANVKISDAEGLLNLIQKFEYIVCYQMKRAQTVFNIEYIIGGIGSTFRKSVLSEIGYYDTDTVTEDIDITMKIIRKGNKTYRAIYGSDVIAYTESVLNVRGLIKQRYRWKWGRSQTFFKNRKMFFNKDAKFTKGLTFIYLPFAIFGDFAFLLEPLLLAFLVFISIYFKNPLTLLSAMAVFIFYLSLNIFAEDTISTKDKLKLVIIAPTMYFYFFILSFVEYVALIKTLQNLRNLKPSIDEARCSWDHVARRAVSINW